MKAVKIDEREVFFCRGCLIIATILAFAVIAELTPEMTEKKTTTLNMSPREFNIVISDIDFAAELGDHNKVDELTSKLWDAVSSEDRESLTAKKYEHRRQD